MPWSSSLSLWMVNIERELLDLEETRLTINFLHPPETPETPVPIIVIFVMSQSDTQRSLNVECIQNLRVSSSQLITVFGTSNDGSQALTWCPGWPE